MKTINVRFMGPARQFNEKGCAQFGLSDDATVKDLRASVRDWLDEQVDNQKMHAILESSVFANEQAVISEDAVLDDSVEYVLIPPISGG